MNDIDKKDYKNTYDYLKSLENDYNDTILVENELINDIMILPNLKGVSESKSSFLELNVYENYMNILLDNSEILPNTISLLNTLNVKQKICFNKSFYNDDYFIDINFIDYKYNIPDHFITKGLECRFDPNIRYYILPIRLRFSQIAHANVIIIDTLFKTIEFFEPHGKMFTGMSQEDPIKYNIEKHISNILNIFFKLLMFKDDDISKYTFLNVQNCIKLDLPEIPGFEIPEILGFEGVQTMQSKVDDKSGHCLAWSLLFIHIRLYNLHLQADDIMNFFILNFTPKEIDVYIKRYITYIENLLPQDFTIKSYRYDYNMQLKENEKQLIESSIITHIENFINVIIDDNKQLKNINDINERKILLKNILKYRNYYDFDRVFSDNIFIALRGYDDDNDDNKKKKIKRKRK